MQVKLSSDKYDIVDHGCVFLFEEDKDLTIDVAAEDFSFSLTIYFLTEETKEQKIEREITGNKIIYKCFNFADVGTGLKNPIEIAQIEGKRLYLIFWSKLEGEKEPKTRSVQYTLFCEK